MSRIKKLILGLSVAVTMAIAFVVGFAGLNQPKATINTPCAPDCELVTPSLKQDKPATYNHAPNTITVKKGGDTINYSYRPDVTTMANEKVVAYEYCFGSTDVDMAVDIESIDATGVNVSYIYSDTKLDTTKLQTSYTDYEVQSVTTSNRWKYIYIVVSAQNNIPTTFTQNVYWYYGKAGTITITDNVNPATYQFPIVQGAEILRLPKIQANGYEVDTYYMDSERTIPATFPISIKGATQLYVAVPNLPTDYLAWDSSTSSYYVKKGSATLPENLVIPESYNNRTNGKANITYIYASSSYSNGVFYNQSTLKSVILPTTIISIGGYAFRDCSGLTSINLPSSLTSIGDSAFLGCGGLTGDLVIPNGVTSIGKMAFQNCSRLTGDLIIPNGVTSIGYQAFYNCSGLTGDVVIPSGITSIGSATFQNCSGLTSITLPSGLTSIDFQAFYNCSGLTGDVIIPSGVTSIGSSTFYQCSGLTSITLPSGLTSIGKSAFYYCIGLTSIDLSECASLTTIGNSAFYSCRGLTSIALPSSLTSIGTSAFSNCYALAEVYNLSTFLTITTGTTDNGHVGCYAKVIHTSADAESTIQTIDNIQYYNDETNFIALAPTSRNITSVTLDSKTTAINQFAFYKCSGLTSIDLSGCTSLTTISERAFYYCSKLTSIVIPASVTKIGSNAFEYCSKLTSITFEDTSTWYYTSSSNYTGGTEIDVSDASANATYFKSTYYSKYWYKV